MGNMRPFIIIGLGNLCALALTAVLMDPVSARYNNTVLTDPDAPYTQEQASPEVCPVGEKRAFNPQVQYEKEMNTVIKEYERALDVIDKDYLSQTNTIRKTFETELQELETRFNQNRIDKATYDNKVREFWKMHNQKQNLASSDFHNKTLSIEASVNRKTEELLKKYGDCENHAH
jgi:hypothetical protein